MSQSAVSRQVSALEKELKVSLFHRHARGLVLTEQGEMLIGTASEIMNKLSTAETLLTDTTTKPTGDLRITAPIGLGTVWVTQRLRQFLELDPDIRIELVLNDDQIDIAMRAADVAIWTSEPQHSDLIRRPLFTMTNPRLRVRALHSSQRCPADARLRSTITPSSPTAARLRRIFAPFVGSRPPAINGKAPRKPAFAANSVLAMKYAIRAGIGIGLIPDYLTGRKPTWCGCCSDVELPTVTRLLRLPEELKTAKKVQVFRDFLVAKARQWKF